jgi:arginine kinase
LEQKREEYRQYLDHSGALDCLTKALIKLYEATERPEDSCKYIRKHMCDSCPDDEDFLRVTGELAVATEKNCQLEKELRSLKGNIKRTNSEVQLTLDTGFLELLADSECKSLLKNHLTEEIFNSLKEVRTEDKATLLDCIQSGLQNHDSGMGIYAPVAAAYSTFAAIFDPIIEAYHGFAADAQHPASDWGEADLENLDPDNEFIVSTRVRCGRNMLDFPFVPKMSEAQYEEVFERVKTVLTGLTDEHSGVFLPLEGMERDVEQQLIDDHFLFKSGDRFLEAAQACRFWPVGRAIFFNAEKTFLVWVNEEDQLRIISMQQGGDFATVYRRLKEGVEKISKDIAFAVSERLGFLTTCPSNLGTALRASVHIRVPKLAADRAQLDEIVEKYHLQVRGTSGEHTEVNEGIFDISNRRRLGLTEYEAVTEMHAGILEIIAREKELQESEGC